MDDTQRLDFLEKLFAENGGLGTVLRECSQDKGWALQNTTDAVCHMLRSDRDELQCEDGGTVRHAIDKMVLALADTGRPAITKED